MDTTQVLSDLRQRFGDKPTFCLPVDNPTEIIIEIGRTEEQSTALAVIDRSEPHYHQKTMEIYQVEKGILTVYVDDDVIDLYEGDQLRILPNQVHWAVGEATAVSVKASPSWTPADHFQHADSTPSLGELFPLYLNFNAGFRKANPEAEIVLPSRGGFDVTMRRLASHPHEMRKLLRHWKMGWEATEDEIKRRTEAVYQKFLPFDPSTNSKKLTAALVWISMQNSSHERYI